MAIYGNVSISEKDGLVRIGKNLIRNKDNIETLELTFDAEEFWECVELAKQYYKR